MVKKTYIKSSDNKEEANIWRKGLRGCRQRKKKKKRKPTKTRREPASQNVKPIHCFPEALTRQNVETQPSLEGFCSPVGLYSSVNSTVSSNLLLFVPLYQLRNILSFALKSRTQPDSTAKWNCCCFIISPTAFQPSLLALFRLDRINLGYCYWC